MAKVIDPADLQAVFGLEPKVAIDYFKSKGYAITWDWHEALDEAHARAFTVAKVARLDVLRAIRQALAEALQKGRTLRQFQEQLTPILQAKGWWGQQVLVDTQGNAELAQLGSPRRLKTIYQTNLQSAYMAGRYKAMMGSVDSHPLWRYVAVLDGKTRPSHRAMSGRVFRYDDPVWSAIYPPNGFNCRCRITAMTLAAAKRRGLVAETSDGRLQQQSIEVGFSKRTGEIRSAQVAALRITDAAGKPMYFRTDPGFNSSPLASSVLDELFLDRAKDALGDAKALQEMQAVLLSAPRQKAWESFVRLAVAAGRKQGRSATLGVLQERELQYLQDQGETVRSGIVTLVDRHLTGAKARRHQGAGNHPSLAEWQALPQAFAQAQQVLWDKANRTLIYVLDAEKGQALKVVVGKGEEVATAFKVDRRGLQGEIKGGKYEVVR